MIPQERALLLHMAENGRGGRGRTDSISWYSCLCSQPRQIFGVGAVRPCQTHLDNDEASQKHSGFLS